MSDDGIHRKLTRSVKRQISTESYSKRTSTRRSKKTAKSTDNETTRPVRKCEKGGCEIIPKCSASVSDKCAGEGNTSRWYHMSKGDHYCNECFENFYRSTKPGYESYMAWRYMWSSYSTTDITFKRFMAEEVMPHWIQCTKSSCQKWRVLPRNVQLSSNLIKTYTCAMYSKERANKDWCFVPEDPRVEDTLQPRWIETLILPPLLSDCPAADLLGAYYSDAVGLNPTCPRCITAVNVFKESKKIKQEITEDGEKIDITSAILQPKIPGMNPHFEPFHQPGRHGAAFCFRPDLMDVDEEAEFIEYSREQIMYLGVRNLVVVLWYLNCKKWLTVEDVAAHLICRGLVRIRCVLEASRIIKYLTRRGLINIGVLSVPHGLELAPKDCEANVIVIGAGAAGLGAAKQLKNFGIRATVLEARDRIGGRIWDDDSFGVCIGKGAQIVTGVVNNPITLICEQAGFPMRYLGEKCELYWDSGKVVDTATDQRMELHFNALLDAVATWKKRSLEDQSLFSKVMDMHNQFLNEANTKFSEEQMKLFFFHLSNLEYACGTNLNQVSAMYWDQNEAYEQFTGDHTMLWLGYSAIAEKLAEGLDIKFGMQVEKVDYSGNNVIISTKTGGKFTATHVVITIPLAVLQRHEMQFNPSLPESKLEALAQLGAGVMEKVILQFSRCFWSSKIKGADFFGYVPPSQSHRGEFPLFCDMSRHGENAESSTYVLVTYLCGDAVSLTEQLTDAEIAVRCTKVLRDIFKDEEVPDPIQYYVTRWKQDPFSRMVYSYVRLGCNGDAYDVLAADIDKKVFFAGEATNRRFPQTVAGAYLSGIREASKILKFVS